MLGVLAVVMIFIRSEKWQNIRYTKSIAAVLLAAAVTAGATYGAIHTGVVGTYFGNLNYAYREIGRASCRERV